MVRVLEQKKPHLGGALHTGIEVARGNRILTMFSDLESNPADVKLLIQTSDQTPGAVVQASRWLPESAFEGYGRGKLICNALAQSGLRLLYPGGATDFTFGFRLYPAKRIRDLAIAEYRHGFVLESLLLIMRLGTPVLEVPCTWRKRAEHTSAIRWTTYLHYLPLALKIRFRPRQQLRLPDPA